ncbi:MAG: LPS sulfotransferase NodH [Bradymonadia bacterium]|jgi:LPS sulfotransferase NodH
MGRDNPNLLWPFRRRAIARLRRTGLYGLASSTAVRTRAAFRPKELPPIRFAIYGQGRTGSRLLCDLLQSHPDITCDLEILAERSLNPRKLVEAHARLASTPAHGFKFKWYQMTERQRVDDVGGFLRGLHDDGWRFLYLRRDNVVRHALSSITLRKTGVPHQFSSKSSETRGYARAHVDVETLRHWIAEKQRREQCELDALGDLPRLNLVYEEDLVGAENQQRATARVADWLGLPPAATTASVRPNTPKRLSDIVENLDELRRAFEDTDIARFLED